MKTSKARFGAHADTLRAWVWTLGDVHAWSLRGFSDRDERQVLAPGRGTLVKDEPVVVHCYTTPVDIQNGLNLAELGGFCRKLGSEARQGEVGLLVGDEYFAIREFGKE